MGGSSMPLAVSHHIPDAGVFAFDESLFIVPDEDGDEHASEEAEYQDFGDDDSLEEGPSFRPAWFDFHCGLFFGCGCGLSCRP